MCVLTLVVFWNVENLFPDRPGFNAKCQGIAKTLMMIADSCLALPDIVALAEVSDSQALKTLLYGTPLRKFGYGFVHYDSPDHRGIDCALLYRKSAVRVRRSKPCHLLDSLGAVIPTRDILLVQTDSLDILVNHHPSKVSVSGEAGREIAMGRMTALCDSLEAEGRRRILCVGDFNDNLWGPFAQGTIKYNGRWDKIDGYFARGLQVRESVFTAPHLLTRDTKFGGLKPFRAWSGPRYIGGVSDHLPLVLVVE